MIHQNQARLAFQNLLGRPIAPGRDDEWVAFRKGWNTAVMLAVGECQEKLATKTGAQALSQRRLLRELIASIVSAKALENQP